jgi:hypothetical protein
MSLVLHPRAASGDRLQIWVGAFGRTAPPNLTWFLDGQTASPNVVRSMESARTVPQMVEPTEPRAFTGLFEFRAGITPDTTFEVQVSEAGPPEESSEPLRVRTLPAAIPRGLGASFNVLLVSCFHQDRDKSGLAGKLVSQLPGAFRPHLTLLLGDQVYLDLPTLANFRDQVDWLADKFEEDYTINWRGTPGYAQVLHAAPSAAVPDDHEYWNNFPHASPFIQNSFTAAGRNRWREAARALYDAFQLSQPAGHARAFELDVPPLSFFLMDNRTFRDANRRSTLPNGVLQQLNRWAARVATNQLFGAVVTGQSVFQEKVSDLQGAIADRHLANYGDYDEIMAVLVGLARAGRPVLCITGDVHWGRLIQATELQSQKPALYEVISSPSSLVATVGKDQLAGLLSVFKKPDPWFRHSNPEKPPEVLKLPQISASLACKVLHPQKGNHVALLAFREAGFGLELSVIYWPIDPDGKVASEKTVRIDLSPVS